MPADTLPEWEQVLSSAARLQQIIPDAVLVGGTAAAMHAHHRFSRDADHIVVDLEHRFDEILAELEAVAGWQTSRVRRPVLILGSLDGIETGIRQLIRKRPLETVRERHGNVDITVPTAREILRIKGVLILKRNATRDYLDFIALAVHIGDHAVTEALISFDDLYPQENGASALQQLQVQLANPMPYDIDETRLTEYKNLAPEWHDWSHVKAAAARLAVLILEQL